MNTKPKKMGHIAICGALSLLFCAAFLSMGALTACAAKTSTVNVETTFTSSAPSMLPAGDDKNHLVGMASSKGKSVFSDGRKADYSNVFVVDVVRGKSAQAQGYSKMTFKDGSWVFFQWEMKLAGLDKAGKPIYAGAGKVLKGTGSNKGIKGAVKFETRRLPVSKEHPKGAGLANVVMTYTLP